MATIEQIDAIVRQHGYSDYRWFDPKEIVVAQWVRMKCEFGCPTYARTASCPPNTPSVEECERFFSEYTAGLVFHFRNVAPERRERVAWSGKINLALAQVERAVFLAGYPKAFLLFMDSCHLCADCGTTRPECKEPKVSRPTPEGMAVDVFSTVRQWGYPVEVLTDPSDPMDRFAFLLVE